MGKRLSQKSLIDSIVDGDEFHVIDKSDLSGGADGTSKRFTGTQLKTYIGTSGGAGSLVYQTEITTNTTLTTQEGLNNVYPVNSASAVTITVPSGVYSENDVINFERRGQGSVEFITSGTAKLRGVRDIDNKYFINDTNSLVSLLCRGSEEFSVVGNLSRGYTGAVTTSSYGVLREDDTAKDVTVIGTGFSSNMTVTVSANATQSSPFTFVSYTEITLHLTAVGAETTTVTVTYDNGDVFVDTDAITIAAPAIPTANIISGYNLDSNSNDNTGTNNGVDTDISYVTGQVSNAAEFNGSTSKITIADTNDLSFGNGSTDSAFSITFGVYFDVVQDSFLVSKRNSPSDKEYQIDVNSGSLRAILFDQSSGGTVNVNFTHSFSATTWYHIALTYSGSGTAAGCKIYVDAVSQTLTDSSAGSYTAMENLTEDVLFGDTAYVSTNELDGRMDEVYFWNKELTSTEVTSIENEFSLGNALV